MKSFKIKREIGFVLALLFMSLLQANEPVTPWQMIKKMQRGINIGNTMEAPYEGQWQSPVQEYYFDDYVDAGFTCVRIPIRWDNHLSATAPFAIDSTWLNRVEQVVDWALQRGLVTIINAHHDRWLYENFPDSLKRFESLWAQIAERFKDKSPNLLFEIINEPYFDLTRAQIDTLNRTILKVIRQSNPTRIVILTGGGNDTSPGLTSYLVVEHLKVPDDPYVMAYFHYYKPRQFTKDDANNSTDYWGSAQDKAQVDEHFDLVKQWVDTAQVPMLLGEFGADNVKPLEPRLEWYSYVTGAARSRGFGFTVWCAGPSSGKYTYLRRKGMWEFEQLNVITGQTSFGGQPVHLPATIEAEEFDFGGQGVAYYDADSVNRFGYLRADEGVEIDTLPAGGYVVILDQPQEWLEYSLQVDTTGYYAVSFRFSTLNNASDLTATFNNQQTTQKFEIAPGGDFKQFVLRSDTLFLDKGFQVMRLKTSTGGVGIDKIEISFLKNGPTSNLITNPGFEQGTAQWSAKQCDLTVVNRPVHAGQAALLVSNRPKVWAGPYQSIKEQLLKSGPGFYIASAFFKTVSDSAVQLKVKVRLDYNGEQHHIASLGMVDSSGWSLVSDTLLLNWEGQLEDANLFLQTGNGFTGDFYADDVSLVLDSTITGIDRGDLSEHQMISDFRLQNYPNPFNATTMIRFYLPQATTLDIEVYNVLGEKINRIHEGFLRAGYHRFEWNGRDRRGNEVASGVYIVTLKTGNICKSRKLLLVR